MSRQVGEDTYADRDEWCPEHDRFVRYLVRERELAASNMRVLKKTFGAAWEPSTLDARLWAFRESTLHSRETLAEALLDHGEVQ